MKTQLESELNLEMVSALMDGQLQGADMSATLAHMGSAEARECWHVYHVVGDVLRSSELAACAHDATFVQRLSERLQAEQRLPVVAGPMSIERAGRPAANDGVFRWKMVAGLASFAAVAALGWGALGSFGPQAAGPQLAQVPPSSPMQIVSLAAPLPPESAASAPNDMGPIMLRDPRLDELLAAHRQATGASALGNSAGFLRNATFEGPGR